MDRGAWGATFHGVTKSWTGVSDLTHMQYFIICVYYIGLSIHLWMDTGCFHFGGILSNSSIDMLVQISVQGLVFTSFVCIPRRGIIGFYGNFTFNFFEESPYHFSRQLYHLTFLSAMHNILISLHPLQ